MDVIRNIFESRKTQSNKCCEEPNIIEMDVRVCTNCGQVIGPVFVTRYNHGCRPLYIYSRVTRFHNTMNKFGITDREIEQLFVQIECAWRTKKYKRKYFLSLKFLVFNLSIFYGYNMRAKYGVSIKDPVRLHKQQIIFQDLLMAVDKDKGTKYFKLLSIHF